jgi:hypothetical protein
MKMLDDDCITPVSTLIVLVVSKFVKRAEVRIVPPWFTILVLGILRVLKAFPPVIVVPTLSELTVTAGDTIIPAMRAPVDS